MKACDRCRSFAINDGKNGRPKGVDTHLCDVCYWRGKAERAESEVQRLAEENAKLAERADYGDGD